MPVGQSGAIVPCCWRDKTAKVLTPATDVTNVDASAAGATSRRRAATPDQDRRQDRATADAVDPADAADCRGQHDQHRSGDGPVAVAPLALTGDATGRQPAAERNQDPGDDQVEDSGAGQQLDPDNRSRDHARHGSGDEQRGQRTASLPLPPVPVQRTRGGDDVVQQVGRGDRRAWRAEHADLKWQQMTPLMADQSPDAGDPGRRSGVKAGLTANRRRRTVGNDEYARFVRRVVRAYARRVAAGDVDALADMTGLATELDQTITHAVIGLRENGYCWAEIAARLGVTRQAAQQRWGHR